MIKRTLILLLLLSLPWALYSDTTAVLKVYTKDGTILFLSETEFLFSNHDGSSIRFKQIRKREKSVVGHHDVFGKCEFRYYHEYDSNKAIIIPKSSSFSLQKRTALLPNKPAIDISLSEFDLLESSYTLKPGTAIDLGTRFLKKDETHAILQQYFSLGICQQLVKPENRNFGLAVSVNFSKRFEDTWSGSKFTFFNSAIHNSFIFDNRAFFHLNLNYELAKSYYTAKTYLNGVYTFDTEEYYHNNVGIAMSLEFQTNNRLRIFNELDLNYEITGFSYQYGDYIAITTTNGSTISTQYKREIIDTKKEEGIFLNSFVYKFGIRLDLPVIDFDIGFKLGAYNNAPTHNEPTALSPIFRMHYQFSRNNKK